jgi:hypothetical protein
LNQNAKVIGFKINDKLFCLLEAKIAEKKIVHSVTGLQKMDTEGFEFFRQAERKER